MRLLLWHSYMRFACFSSVPWSADNVLTLAGRSDEKADAWNRAGLIALSQGDAAILLLAGGQGTRLGTSDPKVAPWLPTCVALPHTYSATHAVFMFVAGRLAAGRLPSCTVPCSKDIQHSAMLSRTGTGSAPAACRVTLV